jgi:hypothetical protein
MQTRVPQYLHLPVQILWFDVHDIVVLIVGLGFSLLLESIVWIPIMAGCVAIIVIKSKKHRGWVLHSIYRLGLARLKGYPLPSCRTFHE